MASSDVASMAVEPSKKPRSRRALKPKNSLANEAVVMAQTPSQSPIPNPPDAGLSKENHESLSQPKKAAAKGKAKQATKKQDTSFDKDLQEMQEMLEKMKLEKEKTEELLKEKDEMLKMKEEELEVQGKEQEKLHMELKKLQKMKEFKPNMVCFLGFRFVFPRRNFFCLCSNFRVRAFVQLFVFSFFPLILSTFDLLGFDKIGKGSRIFR